MSAMPPSKCDDVELAPLIGKVSSEFSSSIWYCGVCMTMGYEMPFCGFSQNVGDTWIEPARLMTMLFVTSRSVRPAYCARVRSTSTLNVGSPRAC
jgi:hypothetical protein